MYLVKLPATEFVAPGIHEHSATPFLSEHNGAVGFDGYC